MHRSVPLLLMFLLHAAALSQTTPTDSQTLQALLAEVRALRHDLQSTSAMAARAQIALYRLQREDEAVARGNRRVSDARTKVGQLEDARHHKAQDIEQDQAVANRSDTSPNAQQEFEEVVLPRLKSELELLQKQEQQARAEQAEAEQHLRDEQMKLEELNDLLDRYNTALEQVSPK